MHIDSRGYYIQYRYLKITCNHRYLLFKDANRYIRRFSTIFQFLLATRVAFPKKNTAGDQRRRVHWGMFEVTCHQRFTRGFLQTKKHHEMARYMFKWEIGWFPDSNVCKYRRVGRFKDSGFELMTEGGSQGNQSRYRSCDTCFVCYSMRPVYEIWSTSDWLKQFWCDHGFTCVDSLQRL